MSRLGLDYGSVSTVNPGLVMTSVSNFGQTGPYRDYGAREINLYAMGGLMYITGDPEREPLHMAARLAQYGAGQNAFAGTLGSAAAPRYYRDWAACGCCYIGVSRDHPGECAEPVQLYGEQLPAHGQSRVRARGVGAVSVPRTGMSGVIAGPDHKWPEMAELMGIAELAEERFDDRAGRGENADELDALMLPWLMRHDRHEIFERAQHQGAGVRVRCRTGRYSGLGTPTGARVLWQRGTSQGRRSGASDDAVEGGRRRLGIGCRADAWAA